MSFFFFNDTATTEIYTLSLHDALPILGVLDAQEPGAGGEIQLTDAMAKLIGEQPFHAVKVDAVRHDCGDRADRKSTRLNSSHANISYAVFCLKKKKKTHKGH